MIPGSDVKMAPYDGPRPKKDYITYQINSVIPQMHSYDQVKELLESGLINETRKFNALMTVSINAYSQGGYSILNNLHASAEVFEARAVLKADSEDINLNGMVSQQNLTGLGDEKYRARWQGDFEFFITTQSAFTIYQLTEFVITGKWVAGDKDNPTDQIDFEQVAP